jgi:hypothetical protein
MTSRSVGLVLPCSGARRLADYCSRAWKRCATNLSHRWILGAPAASQRSPGDLELLDDCDGSLSSNTTILRAVLSDLLAPRHEFMMCAEAQQTHHMNSTKTLLAGAAVAGLMTGSIGVRTFAAGERTPAGVLLQTMVEKHACKGKNSCRGQGGCQPGDQGCKGRNTCKGKGGCATNKR